MSTRKAFKKPLILFIASILVVFNYCGAQTSRSDQPNIIFVLTDDLGFGDVGVFYQNQRRKAKDHGEPWMYTPHLDELADKGATLPHHYCAAPVCAPSRASIMLGVSQGHANIRDNQFDKALEHNHTMATVLRQAGYATAAIGKWGLQGSTRWEENGDEWPSHPLNVGFDYFLGYMRHGDGHEHYPKEGPWRKPKEVWENHSEISDKLDKCYTADLWTAAAKKWITETTRKDTPFFMYLAFDTPHAVLELPTQPYPKGGGLKGGMQWLGKPGEMISTASGKIDSWVHPDYARATYDHDDNTSTPAVAWPETYQRYATSVRRIDTSVGDLIRLLKDLKLYSNTIIVFSSDNGPSLESYLGKDYTENNPDFFNSFGPFDGVKRDVWEGGVRMPTIASWPARIPRGRVVESPSISYDWLPTFADAAGISIPARVDGVSLVPSLTGEGTQDEGLVYIEYFNGGKTPDLAEFHASHRGRNRGQMQLIRMGDHVGVRYDVQSHADDFEIYDVVNDASEIKNLADAEGMNVLQKAMKDKVLQVRRPDAAAERPYDNEWIPAASNRNTTGGLTWKAYNGSFPWAPNVVNLTAAKEGKSTQPDAAVFTADKGNGALLFEGFVKIPKGGEYTFYLTTSADALLRIHHATVIDIHGEKTEGNGKILLQEGLHPIRLYYLMPGEMKPVLDLQWEGPGISRQEIPAAAFAR